MPSQSNPRRGDDKLQQQLQHRREEMQLFQRFRMIASKKLEALANQSEKMGIEYEMGEEEKRIFRQMHGMGLKEGILAGIVTFVILRRGPIVVAQRIHRRQQMQQDSAGIMHHRGTPQPPPTPPSSSSLPPPPRGDGSYQLSTPSQRSGNPFQTVRPDFPRPRNAFLRAIWFSFDSVLSLMMAASVSMAFTDTDKIRHQLLDLPLIEGRSLVCDALCDEISIELEKVREEENPAFLRLQSSMRSLHGHESNGGRNISSTATTPPSPAALYLDGIVLFSENCQRRRHFERRFRLEHGLGKADPVKIPSPGVPKDEPRLVFHANGAEETIGTDETGENIVFPSHLNENSHEMDWVSEFVTDQEQQKKDDDNDKKKSW